jgi:hypothetical protein
MPLHFHNYAASLLHSTSSTIPHRHAPASLWKRYSHLLNCLLLFRRLALELSSTGDLRHFTRALPPLSIASPVRILATVRKSQSRFAPPHWLCTRNICFTLRSEVNALRWQTPCFPWNFNAGVSVTKARIDEICVTAWEAMLTSHV